MSRWKNEPLKQRFMDKVMPEPNSGCWLWTASFRKDGYGQIGLGKKSDGVISAHRASYKLFCDEIPDGSFVLHKCDNKACVNPAHLFLGTQQDNIDDMWSKGRGSRHNSRLSNDDVREIRFLLACGVKHQTIAERFGVSRQSIGSISTGKRYKAA